MIISRVFNVIWIAIFVLLGLAALGILGMIAYSIVRAAKDRYAKLEMVSAKVIRKHTRDLDMSVQLGGPGVTERMSMMDDKKSWNGYTGSLRNPYRKIHEVDAGSWILYIVTFSFEGKEVDFSIPARVYADLEEGDEGMLSFQGEKFKHFVNETIETS